MAQPIDGVSLLGQALEEEGVRALMAHLGELRGVRSRRDGMEGEAEYPEKGVKVLIVGGRVRGLTVYISSTNSDDYHTCTMPLSCGVAGHMSREEVRQHMGAPDDSEEAMEAFGTIIPACDCYDKGKIRTQVVYDDAMRAAAVAFAFKVK